MKKFFLALHLLWLPLPVIGQAVTDDEMGGVPPPPDIPDPLQSGEAIEPEVTIIQKEESVIEEYRINGNLYMVKITPSVGAPYYLIDKDGDGRMESRTTTLGSDVVVPQWVLFSW